MSDVIKVVFLGMDNAGKTTILNILTQKYGLISKTTPTKAIERHTTEIFGFSIVNWDVPGQQKYREELTFKDTRTLKDADVILFIIDVQDLERTSIAIDYFDRILKKLESSPKIPYLGVFIHKFDPDVQNSAQIIKNSNQIRIDINDISVGYNVQFYLTTMFLEPTLFMGFSNVVLQAIQTDKKEQLKRVLKFTTDKLMLDAIIILEKDFIISYHENKQNSLKLLQDFAYNLMTSYNNAKTHNLALEEFKLSQKDYSFVLLPITLRQKEAFVVASSPQPDISLIGEKERLLTALQEALE